MICQCSFQKSKKCSGTPPALPTDCVEEGSNAGPTSQCDLSQFSTNGPTICNNYTLNQIGNFIVGTDRKAFATQILPTSPSFIISTMITLSPSIYPNITVQNPYCLNFCRIYLDQYNYSESIKNSVKNRAGYLLQTHGKGNITVYLRIGPFANLPDSDTVTPLDFLPIIITSKTPPFGCTNASTAGVDGLVVSMIPLSNTGLYKISGTVKAEIFGWVVSGKTLKFFFPDMNQIRIYTVSS